MQSIPLNIAVYNFTKNVRKMLPGPYRFLRIVEGFFFGTFYMYYSYTRFVICITFYLPCYLYLLFAFLFLTR